MASPILLFLATYALYLGVSTTASVPIFAPIDWLHEGERLGTAQIISNGGLPFRDVYLPHGLFPEVIRPTLAFRLFGDSLAADRLMGVFLAPMPYVAALWYLCRVFPTARWFWVGLVTFCLYPLLLLPRHIMVFFVLGGLTAWTYERRSSHLVLSGVLTAASLVLSTFEQTAFLFATILLFPCAMWLESSSPAGSSVAARASAGSSGRVFRSCAIPLWAGALGGCTLFMLYLGATGTLGAFLENVLARFVTDTIIKRDPYPSLSLENLTWYVVPGTYLLLAIMLPYRIWRCREREWSPVLPTLLFGLVSFLYAARGCCPTYGKLATIAFPFVVLVAFAVCLLAERRGQRHESGESRRSRADAAVVLAVLMIGAVVLAGALMKEWNVKQGIPRVLFPFLSSGLMVLGGYAGWEWLKGKRQRLFIAVGCPLFGLILAVCFLNNAKPQLLMAQLRKHVLIKDLARVMPLLVERQGRLSRETPSYLDDELLAFVRESAKQSRPVQLLTTGSGVYYFLSNSQPPNRFPEAYHAMAEGPAREIVESLSRTHANVLVECSYDGHRLNGWWPVHPVLSSFLKDNYRDTGARVSSDMSGPGCPFLVWTHKATGIPGQTG